MTRRRQGTLFDKTSWVSRWCFLYLHHIHQEGRQRRHHHGWRVWLNDNEDYSCISLDKTIRKEMGRAGKETFIPCRYSCPHYITSTPIWWLSYLLWGLPRGKDMEAGVSFYDVTRSSYSKVKYRGAFAVITLAETRSGLVTEEIKAKSSRWLQLALAPRDMDD